MKRELKKMDDYDLEGLLSIVMIFLIIIPVINPGKTNNIGSHTGPNNTPNIVKFEERINPTVTKNAENTYGRKE